MSEPVTAQKKNRLKILPHSPSPGQPVQPRLLIRRCDNGRGVFAGQAIRRGSFITEFSGPRLTRAQLPQPYTAEVDHYMQIGPNRYLGPDGGPDDLINHSCDPNCGLYFDRGGVHCVAIRDIRPGTELTWDYSTTKVNDGFDMTCHCRSRRCRGVVRNFKFLPRARQEYYIQLGIVPAYAIQSARNRRSPLSS